MLPCLEKRYFDIRWLKILKRLNKYSNRQDHFQNVCGVFLKKKIITGQQESIKGSSNADANVGLVF